MKYKIGQRKWTTELEYLEIIDIVDEKYHVRMPIGFRQVTMVLFDTREEAKVECIEFLQSGLFNDKHMLAQVQTAIDRKEKKLKELENEDEI